MNFFTVPTLRFQVLYVFVVLAHDRRRILHFGVNAHSTAEWTTQFRYLSREEYGRLIEAAKTVTSPYYLGDKDRPGRAHGAPTRKPVSLRSDQIDFANRVMRIPRSKSGRPPSVPLNATAFSALHALH